MKKFYQINAYASAPPEILLYEPIGKDFWGDGIGAREFVEDLKALGKVPEIIVAINSDGGNVFVANVMYNALKANSARIKVRIDGVALSAATIVAMAGDEIEMPENAMMMIHQPMWWADGNAKEMRKVADDLDKVGETMLATYQSRTGRTREEIVALLDAETWMNATEAKEYGFADIIGQAVEVTAHFDLSKYKNVPQALLTNRGVVRPPQGRTGSSPNNTQEDDMDYSTITADELRKQRPDLFADITAQSKTEAEKAGAEQERTRVAEITASALPGQGALAAKLINDGVSVDEARKQFIEAAKKGSNPTAQQGKLDNDFQTFQGVTGDGLEDPWAKQQEHQEDQTKITAKATSIAAGFKKR